MDIARSFPEVFRLDSLWAFIGAKLSHLAYAQGDVRPNVAGKT